uniref:CPW-WPC domain-containing protein n=1 Tax=Noctiluca scintillans TaxID=2966 RepID=A0A7S1AYG0_NOCSC|mmetsp:Transcript_6542/g.18365  ORF Transcript_6542/g.18365 Transcript_6542/m.18365 type:complete len:186 (+) Transcript_6542:61-618(+)
MFRLRAMVCFGGCFCLRTVAESILDGLPTEAARLFDVGNRQEQVQTMLEDALAEIGPTLGLPLRDTICVRDYNRCPEGWLDKGDACSPPQQFFGCSPISSGGLTPAEKSAAAHSCAGSLYPCLHSCNVTNYDSSCPAGWFEGVVGCQAPSFYQGPCVRQKTFSMFTIAQKVWWAKQCFVTWPCSS